MKTNQPNVGKIAGLSALFVVAIIVLAVVFSAFDSTDGGQYGVVRATSPHKNHVSKVLQPGSGISWVGVWSETHKYPANQRQYTFTQKRDKDGNVLGDADPVVLPTANGVPVGIEGTLYFTLNSDPKVLTLFDNKFGTRTFDKKHPYDGGEGWSAFLKQVIEPIAVNDIRQELANTPCEDLNASCALIQNQGQVGKVDVTQGQKSNQQIQQVQERINKSLPADVNSQLGGEFLTNVHFTFRGVDLSTVILGKVNTALGAFADISTSQAHVRKEQLEAQANREKQKGYNACAACAQQDIYKAIPGSITVWAPGNPNVSVGTGK